ncbi:MAG TPA: FAD-binding oxidoreductase [Candidatus Saccharimonadales bacterium]|nr:FAD-binding oxidoreductase [Candidatus Saccharimonadales bacterium]
MKSGQIKELEKLIDGSVTDADHARSYFATDGSVFTIMPSAVIYPRSEADVAAAVRYARAEADKSGRKFSLIARGKGTDQAGGALGDGAMVVFPAVMNKILKLTKDTVTVQPGIIFGDLQKTLHTHHRFLPPYPSSIDYATMGGAVANNTCGEKTLKYGATRDWVKRMNVVLDDGSIIETKRISKRELNRKKGLSTREGEIYRGIDGLIQDNLGLIKEAGPKTSKNSAGYALARVKGKDGSFDLGQLLVGAQGTLGITTEITFATAQYEPRTNLVVGYFDSIEKAGEAVLKLQKLNPSAMEVVDFYLLDFLRKNRPESLEDLLPPGDLPKIVILIEFDNHSHFRQNVLGRRAGKILAKLAYAQRTSVDIKEQDRLWQIRRSAAAVIWMNNGPTKALPIIEDGVVPVEKLPEFLEAVYKLLKKHKLEIAVWGHAGNANFHMQPFMDLSKVKDRKKVFEVMDDYYNMVIKMGGSTCGEHNDGLLRAPYLEKLYGKEMYDLFLEVKKICDPKGIFNPRIKLNVTKKDLEPLLRHEYSMKHLYDHMPHS